MSLVATGTLVMAPTNLIRHVSSISRRQAGAFDLDMVLHCKLEWFMLPMTLDMHDEGIR